MTGNLIKNYCFEYEGKYPRISKTAAIFPGVKIIGDVRIGDYSSVWFNSVCRGDVNYVTIGKRTNIQDLSMLHVTSGEFPLKIGDYVTVGHSAKIHGCTIGNNVLIGIGAVVLDGAVIEDDVLIAAGAVVRPGFRAPSGKMLAGVPAKIVRDLTNEEIDEISQSAVHYVEYSKLMLKSFTKG